MHKIFDCILEVRLRIETVNVDVKEISLFKNHQIIRIVHSFSTQLVNIVCYNISVHLEALEGNYSIPITKDT